MGCCLPNSLLSVSWEGRDQFSYKVRCGPQETHLDPAPCDSSMLFSQLWWGFLNWFQFSIKRGDKMKFLHPTKWRMERFTATSGKWRWDLIESNSIPAATLEGDAAFNRNLISEGHSSAMWQVLYWLSKSALISFCLDGGQHNVLFIPLEIQRKGWGKAKFRQQCIKTYISCGGKWIPPSGWLFHVVGKLYHCWNTLDHRYCPDNCNNLFC